MHLKVWVVPGTVFFFQKSEPYFYSVWNFGLMKEQRTESLKSNQGIDEKKNQGIESMRGMRVSSFLRVGSRTLDLMEQLFGPPSLKSYMIEFMSSFIFVFATVGSAVSVGLLMASNESQSPETDLLILSMAHAFAFTVAVYVAPSGHVNPAVTFAYVIGGHISILKAICYLVAQLLGSTLACLFLMLVTSGLAIPTHGLGGRMSGFGGALMEGIVTFILVYTVYAARDPKRGSADGDIGAIAIGFVAGANNLAVGPFTGGSMNPARSFGPAIITNDFKNQWVYWIGPMVGGGLAGLVYDHLICSNADQQPSLGGETVNL